VDERAIGPLATSFAARGVLRFRLVVRLTGEVDLAYDRGSRVVTVWLTPAEAPTSRLTLVGDLPIRPEGSWSGLVGRLGEIFGGPVEERARPLLEEHAAVQVASRLRAGVTGTVDLCTGQVDAVLGALPAGRTPRRPFSEDGSPWLANQRALVHPGSLDAAGPFRTDGERLEVEVEVEEGPGVEARVLCVAQARRVVEAFVASRPAAPVAARAREWLDGAGRATLRVDGAGCDLALLLTPPAEAGAPTRARYRVRRADGEPRQLVDCPE
jgi:hypothetical protein